jgi:hypothetical protein
MAVGVFHASVRGYGLLSSIMAIGTMAGALLGAKRDKPRFGLPWFSSNFEPSECVSTSMSADFVQEPTCTS